MRGHDAPNGRPPFFSCSRKELSVELPCQLLATVIEKTPEQLCYEGSAVTILDEASTDADTMSGRLSRYPPRAQPRKAKLFVRVGLARLLPELTSRRVRTIQRRRLGLITCWLDRHGPTCPGHGVETPSYIESDNHKSQRACYLGIYLIGGGGGVRCRHPSAETGLVDELPRLRALAATWVTYRRRPVLLPIGTAPTNYATSNR